MPNEYEVRCTHCSIGKSEVGQSVGGLVAKHHISAQVEQGKSVLVATIGKCVNCSKVEHIEVKDGAHAYDISHDQIAYVVGKINAYSFNLAQFKGTDMPTPKPIKQYNPNKYGEQEEVAF